jgi:hypothetical protein
MKNPMTHLARTGFAAVALATAAGSANASFVNNSAPDPFFGGPGIILQADAGALISLPGIGPGGADLFTSQIVIDDFTFPSVSTDIFTYTADFFAELLDNTGAPVGGQVDLDNGNFVVEFVGRTSPFQTGTFDLVLSDATFTGTTSVGDTIEVSLANIPTANVTISGLGTGGTGPYLVEYNTPFQVDGQYELNDSGDIITTPGLGDVNGQPTVPVPATAAFLVPGLIGLAAMRRRNRRAAA